jgi:5-hydroxyisourate hydrolase
MNCISTHILDLRLGKPAPGVSVRLEKQDSPANWRLVSSAHSDQEGRCTQLLADGNLSAGVYRLHFDIAAYFTTHQVETLYPFVEVTFQVREGESHFHIPLLLNANGYTTYRGT